MGRRKNPQAIPRLLDVTTLDHDTIERFWSLVSRGESAECWPWLGGTRSKKSGYGCFSIKHVSYLPHRIAWQIAYGATPPGCILHSCDNRLCVNPSHMRVGTWAENNQDKGLKGRSAKGSGHGMAKMSEETVAKILAEHTGKYGCGRQLAKKYGISPQLVSLIFRRKSWKHVPS